MRLIDSLRFACILASALAPAVFGADDAVATPPAIQGNVADVTVDAAGNQYVTGNFNGTVDFNPGVGADIQTAASGDALFVTRFNADGSYGWTAAFGPSASAEGRAIVENNGTLYVAGWAYAYTPPVVQPVAETAAVAAPPISNLPQQISMAIVLAFDAATGDLVTAFGNGGVRTFTGTNGAEGNALTISGNTLCVAGTVQPALYYPVLPVLPVVANGTSASLVATPVPPVTVPTTPPDTAHAFVWALDLTAGSDVATFGTNGVATLSAVSGRAAGQGIADLNDALYVTGTINTGYPWICGPILAGTTPAAGSVASSIIAYPWWGGVSAAFVVSLDDGTGALNTGFGAGGVYTYGDSSSSITACAIAASNGTVYMTGSYAAVTPTGVIDPPPGVALPMLPASGSVGTPSFMPIWGWGNTGASKVYVLALDAAAGTPVSGFGAAGIVNFGRQFSSVGRALLVNGGTLYVAGDYGDRYQLGGFYALPMVAGGGGATTEISALPSGANAASTNFMYPWYGTNSGIPDAFALSLDAASGAVNTAFNSDGYVTFGGTSADSGKALALGNGKLYLAGTFSSTNAGVDGLGNVDATGWGGFLLALDPLAGAGGAGETHQPPYVYAGADQTVELPENPSADNSWAGTAWLNAVVVGDGLPYPPGSTATVAWTQVSGAGTAAFDSPDSPFTDVTFSGVGVYRLQITADDGQYQVSSALTVTVVMNQPPVIDSGPAATPSSGQAGDTITFTAAAHDPDGDDVWYEWDFGDGNWGWGAQTANVYAAAGTYTVTLTVSDGIDTVTRTLQIVISDGTPALNVAQLAFNLDFSGLKTDSVKVAGTLSGLAGKFSPKGLSVDLDVGGLSRQFTLSGKGKAQSAGASFQLKRTGRSWSFQAKLTGTDLSPVLGVANTDGKGSVTVPVSVELGGANFSQSKTVLYAAKEGVGAKGH